MELVHVLQTQKPAQQQQQTPDDPWSICGPEEYPEMYVSLLRSVYKLALICVIMLHMFTTNKRHLEKFN
jgi:hypothetical protein